MIPAICDNEDCRTVWLTDTLHVGHTGPGSVVIRQVKTGPCPKCGQIGHIPDGQYRATSCMLFDPRDVAAIMEALGHVRRWAKRGDTLDAVISRIERRFPFLRPLVPFLPKNVSEVVTYCTLVLGILTLFLQYREKPQQSQTVHLDINVRSVLEELDHGQRSSQHDMTEIHTDTKVEKIEPPDID